MIQGKTVDAEFLDVHEEKEVHRDGSVWHKQVVAYGFQDKDNYRHEYADVPMGWSNEGAKTVKVQYIPGWERHSRLVGQNNRVWVYIFFGSLAAAAVGVIILVKTSP